MTELSEHKQRVATVYNLASSGYDHPAARCVAIGANRLVEFIGLRGGEHILDVATGTGMAALAAARLVGPQGKVVGVDIADDMLFQARRNIQEAGLANCEVRYGDMEHLDFADDTFDAVICGLGVFFLPEMVTGPQEWRRVTKRSGAVAFSSFGESAFQPMSDIFESIIRTYGVAFPVPRRPFGWQRIPHPEQCVGLLGDAGLVSTDVHVEQIGYYLQSAEEWWDFLWGTGYRGALSQLTPDKVEQFKEEHLKEIDKLATHQGIWLDVPYITALGRK